MLGYFISTHFLIYIQLVFWIFLICNQFYIFLVKYIVIKYTHIIICTHTEHTEHHHYRTLHFFLHFPLVFFKKKIKYIYIIWSRRMTAKWPSENQIVQRYYFIIMFTYFNIFEELLYHFISLLYVYNTWCCCTGENKLLYSTLLPIMRKSKIFRKILKYWLACFYIVYIFVPQWVFLSEEIFCTIFFYGKNSWGYLITMVYHF